MLYSGCGSPHCLVLLLLLLKVPWHNSTKKKDPLYGGYHGGPCLFICIIFLQKEKDGTYRKYSVLAVLFAISGLICWCGISQVISNSVTSAFKNAFSVPPLATTIILVVLAAIIVLRKNATVKVLDIMVPIMACAYFIFTVIIILTHLGQMPDVLHVFSRKHSVSARLQPAVSVLY